MFSLYNIFIGMLFGFLAFLYYLPTFKAFNENHPNKDTILVVNLITGWSVIGWLVALIWAFKK